MDFVHPIEAVIPGAQGHILAVLAETTAELNLSTIARLAGVSQAQASRLLPGLVELGIVERREVPPSSLFRLVPEHVASRLLLGLSRAGDAVQLEIGEIARRLPRQPVSVIVFGSLARGTADVESDVDVAVVRPDDIDDDDDDEDWLASIEHLRAAVARLTGNAVELLEVGAGQVSTRLADDEGVWAAIRREGVVVHGLSLDELQGVRHG